MEVVREGTVVGEETLDNTEDNGTEKVETSRKSDVERKYFDNEVHTFHLSPHVFRLGIQKRFEFRNSKDLHNVALFINVI